MNLKEQIAAAVEELAAIPFFPTESGARLGIMRAIEKFVSGEVELRWLIDTAVGRMREWKGVAELRALYCTRFKPKDGIEEWCTIPGFTAADSEQAHSLEAASNKRLELEVPRSLLSSKVSTGGDAIPERAEGGGQPTDGARPPESRDATQRRQSG